MKIELDRCITEVSIPLKSRDLNWSLQVSCKNIDQTFRLKCESF